MKNFRNNSERFGQVGIVCSERDLREIIIYFNPEYTDDDVTLEIVDALRCDDIEELDND